MDEREATNEVRAAIAAAIGMDQTSIRLVSRHSENCLEVHMEDGSGFQVQIVQFRNTKDGG